MANSPRQTRRKRKRSSKERAKEVGAGASGSSWTVGRVRALLRALLDALLPPRCLSCGREAQEPASLCSTCWNGLTFISRPHCLCCRLPFEIAAGEEALCGACLRERPTYDRARAALVYDEASRRLLLPFKHADRSESARLFLGWLQLAGDELLEEAEIIAPVPLHWRRLLKRRYNQAALLSQGLAARSGRLGAPRSPGSPPRHGEPGQEEPRGQAAQRRRGLRRPPALALPPQGKARPPARRRDDHGRHGRGLRARLEARWGGGGISPAFGAGGQVTKRLRLPT